MLVNKLWESISWVLLMLCAIYGILWLATLGGCSAMERADLTQLSVQTATNTALDRLEAKLGLMSQQTPTQPISEGGMAGIVAAMNGALALFYLVRKKWFPIKATKLKLPKLRKPKS